MTQDAKALKPCPFCGGEGEPHENANSPDTGLHWIRCKVCGADGPSETLDAIASWNHRPLQDGEATEGEMRAAWEYGRESWCPEGILADTERTEREWQKARAALTRNAEAVAGIGNLLTNCAQILDVVQGEWSKDGSWSAWDQSVRDGISKTLARLYATPPVAQTGTVGISDAMVADLLEFYRTSEAIRAAEHEYYEKSQGLDGGWEITQRGGFSQLEAESRRIDELTLRLIDLRRVLAALSAPMVEEKGL